MAKTRLGPHVRKTYDIAQTPFQRFCEAHTLCEETQAALQAQVQNLNPLALHQKLEKAIANVQDDQVALATAAD